MPSFHFRRPVALASVFAVGAAAFIGGTTAANASLPGLSSSLLSSSDGSTSIKFSNGTALTAPESITDASWSPDGSRAIYADPDGGLSTVRYNDGQNLWWTVLPDPTVERRSPSWRGDGSTVVWAERPSESALWHLKVGNSNFSGNPNDITPIDGKHYLNPDGGPDLRVVYQVQAELRGTPDVGIYDPAAPGPDQFTTILTNASNPAISPDGTKVAFVRSDGSYNQIWVSDLQGGNLVQLTANGVSHDNPTWSPTGTLIAFSQGSGVATVPSNSSGPTNPTVVSGLTEVPAYQPRNKDRVARLAGAGRFETATAVSQSHWATASTSADQREKAGAVVLSRSDTFADALSGSALAAAKGGPLLMTPPTSLQTATKAEIQRVLAPGGTVYLLGSTGALSQDVQNQIAALGYNPVRIAGSDRFSTSIAIAKAIDPTPDLVLAATGMNFPDALAAGAAAGSYDTPGSTSSAVVVLTNNTLLPASTKSFLDANPSSTVFGIGTQAVTATRAYNPIDLGGSNRYETALFTAWTFFGGQNYVGVATGTNWPDALAGGALMAVLNGPLMLTPGTSTQIGLELELVLDQASGSIHTGLVFGGTGAVNGAQNAQIGTWLSGPAGYTLVTNPTNVGTAAMGTASTLSAEGSTAKQLAPEADATDVHRSVAEMEAAAKTVRERIAK